MLANDVLESEVPDRWSMANSRMGEYSYSCIEPPLPCRTVKWTRLDDADEVQVYKIEITVERDNAEPLTETVSLSYCGEPTSVVELDSVRVQIVPAETGSE